MAKLMLGLLLVILGVASVFLKEYVARDKYPYLKYVLPAILIIVGIIQMCVEIVAYCGARREEALAATVGHLERTYILDSHNGIFPQMEIGQSGAIFHLKGTYTDEAHVNVLGRAFEINDFSICVEGGAVMVSAKFRNSEGEMIAELVDNEWVHKPLESNLIWDRNYSENALEVRDAKGRVVLQIRMLRDRIQLQGVFYDEDGRGRAIYASNDPKRRGALVDPNVTEDAFPEIRPMFKYPSSTHLGSYSEYW